MSLTNPLTGRAIKERGPTHLKLLKAMDTILEILREHDEVEQHGGFGKLLGKLAKSGKKAVAKGKATAKNKKSRQNFFESLKDKSQSLDEPPGNRGGADGEDLVIPKSKYHLISSALPPNPEHQSWYHYHAPFSQSFGDYVCLKRSTLKDLGLFLRDTLTSDVAPIQVQQ
jgi:hypothetical protein